MISEKALTEAVLEQALLDKELEQKNINQIMFPDLKRMTEERLSYEVRDIKIALKWVKSL